MYWQPTSVLPMAGGGADVSRFFHAPHSSILHKLVPRQSQTYVPVDSHVSTLHSALFEGPLTWRKHVPVESTLGAHAQAVEVKRHPAIGCKLWALGVTTNPSMAAS